MRDKRVVYGGGAAEIATSLAVDAAAVKVRPFVMLLLSLPRSLLYPCLYPCLSWG